MIPSFRKGILASSPQEQNETDKLVTELQITFANLQESSKSFHNPE